MAAIVVPGQFLVPDRISQGATATPPNVVSAVAFPASDFTMSGSSAVDLLDGAGGNPIAVTLVKVSASSSVLISAAASVRMNTAANAGIRAWNGASAMNLSRDRPNLTPIGSLLYGEVLWSGLAAGNWTFTLQVFSSAGAVLNFGTGQSAFISAMEV